MEKKFTHVLLISIIPVLLSSCRSSPTGPHVSGNVQLSADYVTCTAVWLKITSSGQQSTAADGAYKITRDGDTVLTGSLTGMDTLVIDTTAQPQRTYTYKGYWFVNGEVSDTSLPLQVTTLDTTTNNWTFQSWTFGDNCGSSTLSDVAIINDTLAYAVGEIYLQDSTTGQCDPQPYNLGIWNGHGWKLQKAPFYYQGQALYNPIYSLTAFGPTDVWLGTASVIHWNGETFIPLDNSGVWGPHRIYKMWGTSSYNFYIVGDSGSVAKYDGYTWTKIESGVTSTVNDSWGMPGGTSSQPIVLATTLHNGILSLTPKGATSALEWPGGDIGSIWFADTNEVYVGGGGVYVKDERGWRRVYYRAGMYVDGMRGSGATNIFAVGWGLFAHFNGSSWQEYPQIESIANLWSVAVAKDMVVAVGFTGGGPYMRGILIVGKDN